MPRGDRTGPMGYGPMTGRGLGYCAGYSTPGYMHPGPGLGLGLGWGRGWGWRNWYRATGVPGWARGGWGAAPWWGWGAAPTAPVAEQEREFLKAQAASLQQQLDAIRARLEELEREGGTEEG